MSVLNCSYTTVNKCFDYLNLPIAHNILWVSYNAWMETVLCQSESIVVASNKYSSNFVKAKMLKLNKYHIEYVMDCWKNLKDVPRNVRKYMLAALFNAPSTCDAYIQVEVNRDMADPNAPWKIANVDWQVRIA